VFDVKTKNVLFMDANQYLDLYRIDGGEKLLPALEEQRHHIFVPEQIVHEVQRNKVFIFARFLDDMMKSLNASGGVIPNHLPNTVGDQLREVREKLNKTKEEFRKHTPDHLERLMQSRDEVSAALQKTFSNAVKHTEEQLRCARERRERGNPPGKKGDPLGDQLTWEQILSHCEGEFKLWIITKDSDYATTYQRKMYLNAFLYEELASKCHTTPQVFCFDNIGDGVAHFAKETHAKAEKLPTPTETEQLKKEQESLPSLRWLGEYDDSYERQARFAEATGNVFLRPGTLTTLRPWLEPETQAQISTLLNKFAVDFDAPPLTETLAKIAASIPKPGIGKTSDKPKKATDKE